MRLPENDEGKRVPSYETFRRIRELGHSNISDETAAALATMLDVDVDEVYAAARIRPRLGRFELPSRADRLDGPARKAVLGVIDAILSAGEGQNPGLLRAVDPDVYEDVAARETTD